MLQSLYIKNFALIGEIYLEFKDGLNIFLGETGAGKSIVIDALLTTLGERTSPDLVKSGETKAIVEATFSVENPNIINSIVKDTENVIGNTFILRREISTRGTSRCFLNDTPYPLTVIKEIGDYLVDFHGQHTHQQLLLPKFQIQLLDSISNTEELLEKYKQMKKQLEEKIDTLTRLEQDLILMQKEKEKVDFELQELLRINPQPEELETIEQQLKKLENIEIINNTLNEVNEIIYRSDRSVVDNISFAIKKLETLLKYDKSLEDLVNQLETVLESITEISTELQKKFIDIEYDPEYINNLRTRLSELKYLEKKYLSYENIFVEKERLQKMILSTYSLEDEIKNIRNEILHLKEQIKSIAVEIHNKRLEGIQTLEDKIPEILETLGMKNVIFQVSSTFEESSNSDIKDLTIEIEGKNVKLNPNGIDRIEFLISTNPASKPQPLDNIASGGELSRLMLALKSISAEHYKFPTMIFDEIDVGISGKIASMTAQLMKKIAQNHQIIAITHLPQIASAGNHTILIEKKEKNGNFEITARSLSETERIIEIARLLSGEMVSEFAIENAKKLISEINSLGL
ncbi:MAG: DNA repair protein RecN [Candidatus Kapaibacterium sp.]|nr:MAG: DNA repair protein RecN [Candidatus Kapabacteria bacterium]